MKTFLQNLLFLAVSIAFISCNEVDPKENSNDLIDNSEKSSIKDEVVNSEVENEFISETEEPEYDADGNQYEFEQEMLTAEDEQVIYYLQYVHEQFDTVPKELEVTFVGVELGDYFHVMFEDKDGNYYDFGDADNDYSEYELWIENPDFMGNPDYVDKKFILKWEWLTGSFLCCEGAYNSATAEIPTIVELELLD